MVEIYQVFSEGFKKPEVDSIEGCNSRRKTYFGCLIEKKNELTKTISDFKDYKSEVSKLQNECYESNTLASCESYFSKYDLRY